MNSLYSRCSEAYSIWQDLRIWEFFYAGLSWLGEYETSVIAWYYNVNIRVIHKHVIEYFRYVSFDKVIYELCNLILVKYIKFQNFLFLEEGFCVS